MAGKRAKLEKLRRKSVGRAPAWLKTVAIAKPRKQRVGGTFGPASPVISIDPETGEPKGAA